jgi:BMFP domain-containing protein YqiC
MSADRFTEILNYLSAISRDMGEFRQETKARFERLEARMDGFEARMGGLEARMERIETEMRAGFEQVRTDIRLLGRQMEVVTQDLMALRTGHRDLETRLSSLEAKQGTATPPT